MRWQMCVAALAITTCVWAEDQPTTTRQSLEDPVPLLEREAATVRETLEKIGRELDVIRSSQPAAQNDEGRNAELKRSQGLNELRNMNQIRLNELMEQLRQKRKEQLQQAFGDECTLTLTDKEPIRNVSLVSILNVAGHQMLQFRSKSDGTLWTVDPQRIVMAQITH